jgi:hypothetical protein
MVRTNRLDSGTLAENVKASLKKAEKMVKQNRKANTRLLVTGMTSSAA